MTEDAASRFESLYRQHFRAVLRYALGRVGPDSAKDVTAETFLIAWRRLPEVPRDPVPWLIGVARKVIAGELRSQSRRDALRHRIRLAGPSQASHGGIAERLSERDALLCALAALGDTDREALRLIAWDGLSSTAAAEALGMSRLAFGVRLHRARKRFAAALHKADDVGPAGAPSPPRPAGQSPSLPGDSHPFTPAREAR